MLRDLILVLNSASAGINLATCLIGRGDLVNLTVAIFNCAVIIVITIGVVKK